MRRALVMTALLLPLSGCYTAPPPPPPPGYGYAPPAYPTPAYPTPAYPTPGYPPPGYAPAPYDPYGQVYPGYTEDNGIPMMMVDGMAMALILSGGEWGYWDREHRWRHAPDAVNRHLHERQAGGVPGRAGGSPPAGGYTPRPLDRAPTAGGYTPRPPDRTPTAGGYAPRPPDRTPAGGERVGATPSPRPLAPGPSAVRPAAVQAPAPRPAPAPQAAPQERRRECPNGQPRC
jgi:hypothetical protein